MSLTLLPPPPLPHEAFQHLHRNGSMNGLGWLTHLTSRSRYVDDTVRMDGWIDGWMGGGIEEWMDGLPDPPDFLVQICPRYSREDCAI